MLVAMSWLKDYVDIDVDDFEFAKAMTMSGSKVESIRQSGREIVNVVTGRAVTIEAHPNADKLRVCMVDVGDKDNIQIVTGASNVQEGDCVPIALDGAKLPGGIKIKTGKLRGVLSHGMMCSINELALDTAMFPDANSEGIFILPKDTPVGIDIREVLGINDTVVEFEITPNRPDCLSIIGIAREAGATFKKPVKYPEIELVEDESKGVDDYISVEIKDPDLCKRYAARVIEDVRIEPSPEWMQRRLRASGIRPINNIVDVTNFVMLEFGQPMHAFDLEEISGGQIVVRRASKDETIVTLDDKERKLDTDMLVIADKDKALAVAGVFGGKHSGIKEESKTILLESANFDGVSIRKTSDKLVLRTEASSRYEKGLDVNVVSLALDRCAQLISKIGAGKPIKGVVDCYPKKAKQKIIDFDVKKINKLLGTDINEDDAINILERIELKVDINSKKVIVPTFRDDIEGTADLAEELARFYGYNNITPTLLEGCSTTIGVRTYEQEIEDIIIDTMTACGLCETYSFSFTTPRVFDKIRLPEQSSQRNAIVISNPLGEEQSIMRTTIIPDILTTLSNNFNRRVREAGVFELSNVYLAHKLPPEELPKEKKLLTIGMYGNVDFYNIKGIIEALLIRLGINENNYEFTKKDDNLTFHSGRTAGIVIEGTEAGIVGEIHPEVTKNFEIEERVYVAVIDVELLIANSNISYKYIPLTKFPPVDRDIAIVVSDDVTAKTLEDLIRNCSEGLLEEVVLFDIYKGKQVADGYKSMAYSLRFRSFDRTLTDEEVNLIMNNIIEQLKDKVGAVLRG